MALSGPTNASSPPVQASFRLLYLGPLVSYVDRFALPPLLLSVARDLDHSLAATSVLATCYFFAYGLMQLFWGLLSDRVGRVRVMRWALAGMAVANLVAATAPTLAVLVLSKAVAGAFAAALLPAAMVYVADAVPFDRRQQVIANIMAAGAIGTVTGTVTAGLLSGLATWRLAFLVTVPFAFGLAVAFLRLPESLPDRPAGGGLSQVWRVLANRWARFLLAVAVLEGAVVLGFLTFLAPALEAHGASTVVAGLVVAVYGVAVFFASQAVKRAVRRQAVSPPTLIAGGGVLLTVAYVLAALGQGVPNILAASALIGLGFAMLHSTLQTWATELAPESRGTATSLFVTAVFTGAAIGAAAVSGLAGADRFGTLFLVAAAVAVPVTVLAAWGRAHYPSPGSGTLRGS